MEFELLKFLASKDLCGSTPQALEARRREKKGARKTKTSISLSMSLFCGPALEGLQASTSSVTGGSFVECSGRLDKGDFEQKWNHWNSFFFFSNCLAGTVCQKSPGGLAGLGTRAEIISISDGLYPGTAKRPRRRPERVRRQRQ